MGDSFDDKQLVERSVAGDDGAYQMLVERYENLVWDILNRMIGSVSDREELAQDVFLKAYFSLEKFRFESKFSTWLYTIAYREALSYLRKRAPITVEFESNHLDQDQAPNEGEAEHTVVAEELLRALDALNIEDKTVVTLYHLHNCSIEEIAVMVSKPEGTVKNQLFRARKKLKAHLEQEQEK